MLPLVLATLLLAGCGGGMGLDKVAADRSIVTNSVPAQPTLDEQTKSDKVTISNAVTSANITELNGAPLSWANAETGSQGTISDLGEYRDREAICRRFNVSRESFSGVALYRGDICFRQGGSWAMRSFAPL